MRLKVECYSGYKADERPVCFTPQTTGARSYVVREVLDQWYGVGCEWFKVLADDKCLYILRHDTAEDDWTLESFRQAPPSHEKTVPNRPRRGRV